MVCLMESNEMMGFINGRFKKPQETGGNYWKWKRSDTLVRGWIFGSMCEDVMTTVMGHTTTKDVWIKLRTTYGTRTPMVEHTTSNKGIVSCSFVSLSS